MFDVEDASCTPTAGGVLHARLDEVDLAVADTDARLEVLVDYERCAAQLAARQYQVLTLLDPGDGGSGDDWVREDVAAALGIAPDTARGRLGLARTLYHRLAATWRLLHDGTLGLAHARALAVAVEEYRLTDEQVAVVEEWVLRKPDLPIGRFKARIRYAIGKYAPARPNRPAPTPPPTAPRGTPQATGRPAPWSSTAPPRSHSSPGD